MPLKSWEGHLKEMSVIVKVKAIRGFVYDGGIVEPGEVVAVPKGFARQLIHASQAVEFKEPEPTPEPQPEPSTPEGPQSGAEVTNQAPVLETQVPDQGRGARRGKNSD